MRSKYAGVKFCENCNEMLGHYENSEGLATCRKCGKIN